MGLLKKAYMQRALTEEARGNYKQAAAYYSKAGEYEKVGEMYELLGDMTRPFPAKIRAYQQAVRWYKKPEHLEQMAGKLANTMEVEIRADKKVAAMERHRLPQVAEYYALAKQWEQAGRIYEELGLYEKATEMYVQGGAIEKVEQISDRQVTHDHKVYQAQEFYDQAVAQYQAGKRDKAYQLLRECLALDERHQDAQALFHTLERAWKPGSVRHIQLPSEEREYCVLAKSVILIGRQEDCDLLLPQADVSRHHARLGFHQKTLMVEDMNSSNGTRLNGLRIQRSATVQDRDRVTFGLSTEFEVRIRKSATRITATLHALDHQALAAEYIIFSGEIQIGHHEECDILLHDVFATAPSPLFKMTYRQPCWHLSLHPRLADVELNNTLVNDYVVVIAGDTLTSAGASLLFE